MGGGHVAGIGWACGVERLSMLLDAAPTLPRPIAVIPVGEDTQDEAIKIAYKLRRAGYRVEHSYTGNMKKRMIKANKVNACTAVIIGSDELSAQKITLKDLDKGEQKTVALADLLKELN
jgi:histidyl-tRNA synthetase